MKSKTSLHILFFPFMAQGHILPTLDLAKLFAARGLKSTILTTPSNASLFHPSIARANESGHLPYPIQLHLIPFPANTGLPEGCENMSSVTPNLLSNFFEAVGMLREPFAQVLREIKPDCVVTGMFFPWTYDVATEQGIPRLVFHTSNMFVLCVSYSLDRYKVMENLPEEAESVVIPGLPHKLEMLKSQMPDHNKVIPQLENLFKQAKVSDSKSFGVVANSFYELESDYINHYRSVAGIRSWHVGPMSLCNYDTTDEAKRGNTSSIDNDACLKWLDKFNPASVLYVCFGSLGRLTDKQLNELALGLEASNHPFIWVVRKDGEELMPEGFEKRIEGRGLVIRGWAPQILILNHASVGGFLTHCGWNSTLEAISAGLQLITWPLYAEQFYNERLIVEILKIGVAIGAKDYTMRPEERTLVEANTIDKTVKRLMDESEEATERKNRAKEFGKLAKRAVEEDGSSYVDMTNLIQELQEMQGKKN